MGPYLKHRRLRRSIMFTTSMRKYGVNDIVQFLNDVEKTTIGMDEWVQRLAAQHTSERSSYPPYNLVKESNTDFKLEVALAGYNRKDIDVYSELNKLVVEAKKSDDDDSEYVHRGLARRAFTRTWTLSDDVKIDENIGSFAFKMIIFQQFRHALTRHDPKTYPP